LVLSREAQQDTEKPLKFRAEANSGLLQLEKNARRCFRDWKISVPNEESGTFSRKKYRIVGTCPVVQAKIRRTLQKKLKETKNTLDSKPLSGETPCRASNCLPP
jgi:hypothetical protein